MHSVQETMNGEQPRMRACFMEGPAGTGKTFTYNECLKELERRGVSHVATSFSGIASTLLRKGQTVHSAFKLPVPVLDGARCNIDVNSRRADVLLHSHLFIIDEVSMLPAPALQAIDLCLQDICRNNIPFGGKTILLGGDFRQVLPIIPRANPATIIENTVKTHLFGRQ